MLQLSKRLQCIADYVNAGSIMADIGTDHAFLPVYLVQKGVCPRAVAADINYGPLEAARANVSQYGLIEQIELRLGNGLQVLEPGEVDTIVIAGMGGGTIRDILQASPNVVEKAVRFIFQPMADDLVLRQYLLENGWRLVDEELLIEDGRLYLVIVAEKGEEEIRDPILLEIGPRLLEKKHPLLELSLQRIKQKYQRILEGLAKSTQSTAMKKALFIKEKLARLENIKIK